jgi:predicted amidohydrolase
MENNKKKTLIRAAVVQTNSGYNKDENLERCVALAKTAIRDGAQFILYPELFNQRTTSTAKLVPELIPGPSLEPLMTLAKDHGVTILAGSLCEQSGQRKKSYNTSVLINTEGKLACAYRKMHLFDVDIGEKRVRESAAYLPGNGPQICDVLGQKLGMSICYDLRFPELYRRYATDGATMLSVPASFTTPTGESHWDVLIRARAIENQCFVLAPNQVGAGAGNIPTFGNSLMVDPWGNVLARGSADKEGVLVADLDFSKLQEIRRNMPSLSHRKM